MGAADDPIKAAEAVNLMADLLMAIKLNNEAIHALSLGDTSNAQRLNQEASSQLVETLEAMKKIASNYGYQPSDG